MKNLILILGVFLISVPGCKMNGADSSNGKQNSNSTVQQSSKAVDPKEALTSAFKKLRNVPFATLKTERDGSSAIVEQYSSANSSYSRKTEDGEGTETIIVGADAFSRMNKYFPWKKESNSSDSADKAFFFSLDYLAEKIILASTVKSGGEETVNGKTAAVYESSLAERDPEIPTSIKIWIGKENGLPLKIDKESKVGSKVTHIFDFDSAVNIERPALDKK